mmetsp:Transcript_15676/g.43856  ORF Transcript_15676/g.43856 Transcript_15676/m.43856 type:complete len:218 (-) Transcript_15676:1027-1680(-)
MSLATAYLVVYNIAQAGGWLSVLLLTALTIQRGGSAEDVYSATGFLVCCFQGLSLLETLHAATGLVRSGVAAALIQWVGRSHVLFAVLYAVPELHGSLAVTPLFTVWAISEIIRYPWYAATLLDACPAFLTWLRYTAFIVLYPIGVLSEVWILVEVLPIAKETRMYNVTMPNAINFGFDYYIFLLVGLSIYPFAWFQLYSQLLRARGKKLGKKDKPN